MPKGSHTRNLIYLCNIGYATGGMEKFNKYSSIVCLYYPIVLHRWIVPFADSFHFTKNRASYVLRRLYGALRCGQFCSIHFSNDEKQRGKKTTTNLERRST